jgi:hypothetical protein
VDVGKPFLAEPAGVDPTGAQWGSNAADMAYILYQEPVMIAVHGQHAQEPQARGVAHG